MSKINKAAILQPQFKRKPVTVEEWGGITAYVREMSAQERMGFEDVLFEGEGKDRKAVDMPQKLIVMCVVDEDGQRVFDLSDVEALKSQPYSLTEQLTMLALELNGMRKADTEAAVKNS